jgi:hypothetical protein
MRAAAIQPGYGFTWRAEMQRLLNHARRFVLVHESSDSDAALEHTGGFDHADHSEGADDRRLRSIWLRANRAGLEQYCRGLLVIQADVHRRVQTRQVEMSLVAGSGLRVMVISSMQIAATLAPVLLKDAGRNLKASRRRSISLP